MVNGCTGDHRKLDVRLARRLNRRIVSSQQCKSFSRDNVDNDGLEECDEEYRKFLNSLPEFGNCIDENVEDKLEDFGNYIDDNGISRCNWSDEKDDPVYKIFFQHLTKEGKSFKLEIPSVNGKKVYVKYEEDEQSSPKNDQNSQKLGTTRILRSASKKEIESPAKESLVPLSQEEFSLDCAKTISHGVNENSSTMPGSGLLHSTKHLSLSDSDSDLLDEDYRTFLTDFLCDDGQRLMYMPVDGRPFVYEEDESIADSEVVLMDTDPCTPVHDAFGRKYFRPTVSISNSGALISMYFNGEGHICFCLFFVVSCSMLYTDRSFFSFQMDVDSGKCLQSPGICKNSNFRERLIKVLQEPYDQKEYEDHLDEVSCRKAHVRHRELRSGVLKAYTLESRGKSYLNLYSGECFYSQCNFLYDLN